jgi:hypothetical protein
MTESNKVAASTEVIYAFNRIPYALLSEETDSSSGLLQELTDIAKYYSIYQKGKSFTTEGTKGDYVPAALRYKLCASLINKEARFLFAESPDITIVSKADAGKVTDEAKDALTNQNALVSSILKSNNFEEALLKAARDCFIGKRVLGLVNFNEEDGVTVSFLPSTQFVFDTKIGNPSILTKVVCFIIVKDSRSQKEKRIFKKKYTAEDDKVYLEEAMYDGAGSLIEEITPKQEILLKSIPAVVFLNDGLTGDLDGESEVELLQDYEQWYSKMACSDLDSERKSMNPVRYTIDMNPASTKNLSSSAGSFWDLSSDVNNDKASPQVGTLENQMSYSDSLKLSLERLKSFGYDQIDMPNINIETMVGSITSGKALKAIYWPLIVRCKEKMKMWGPNLSRMVEIIIEGAKAYPNTIKKYIQNPIVPVDYTVEVAQNIPIPEDESEERNMDLAEVQAGTMSRKFYMKKWRKISDDDAEDELEQVAKERQTTENSYFPNS